MAETVPGFGATTRFAAFAPAGVRRNVVMRINVEVQRVFSVFKLPAVVEKLNTLGLVPGNF